MFFLRGHFQPELIYDSVFSRFRFGIGGETKPQQFSDTSVLSKRKNSQTCILALFHKLPKQSKPQKICNPNERIALKHITKLNLKCNLVIIFNPCGRLNTSEGVMKT